MKFWGYNVSIFLLVSELIMEERRELLDDDMFVEFKILKVGDFVSLFLVYKFFNVDENEDNMESNEEMVEDGSWKILELDEMDDLNILLF